MNAHLAHLPATMYYLYYLPSRPAAMRAQRDDDQRRDRRRHGLEEPAAVEQGQRVGAPVPSIATSTATPTALPICRVALPV